MDIVSDKLFNILQVEPGEDLEDIYDETRSQLRKQHIVTDNFEELEVGKIKRQAPLLAESDVRYAGRRVSRKDIEEHISAADMPSSASETASELSDDDSKLPYKDGNKRQHHFQETANVDKAGESDDSAVEWADEADSSSDGDDSEMEDDDSTEMSDASEHDDDDDGGDDGASEDLSSGETEGSANDKNTSSAFNAVSETEVAGELEKAKCTLRQIKLWEDLLRLRISLQKAMVVVNQLPQPDAWHSFMAEADESCRQMASTVRCGLKRLLDSLLLLQTTMLASNADTTPVLEADDSSAQHSNTQEKVEGKAADVGDDEEITSESEVEAEKTAVDSESENRRRMKRKLKLTEFPDLLAKRHKAFQKYRNSTIQKWHDKTHLMSSKVGKGFDAFDQSVLKQIQQTLSDQPRLLARTRSNRLGHRVLGKPSHIAATDEPPPLDVGDAPREDPLKVADPEIFDDNDFYHHILQEFIQHKNSYDPVILTKQWLEIQQYRKRAKKVVDRKASKGRKTRYNVHKPLINFMAPFTNADSWSDEQRDDLFKNLFGKSELGTLP